MPWNSTLHVCANSRKAVLAACILASLFVSAVNGAEPVARVVVVVHNHAGLPAETVNRAQAQAAAIFEQAGVTIEWWEPLRSESTIVYVPAVEPPVFFLRLLPDAMISQAPSRAWGGAQGDQAYVFADRIQRDAAKASLSFAKTLGHIMAHELGHLLLHDQGHALGSIMSPEMEEWALRQLQWSTLHFTSTQAQRMRDRIRALKAAGRAGQ